MAHRGIEKRFKNFDILTHSSNEYKWHLTDNEPSLPNAVITGSQSEKLLIGKCSIRDNGYESEVIGTIKRLNSVWILNIAFNGLTIKCNKFQVLLCLK